MVGLGDFLHHLPNHRWPWENSLEAYCNNRDIDHLRQEVINM